MVSSELQTKIQATLNIPTLPSTIAQLREVMSQPDAGVAAVAEIIDQDPPVTAKVLQLANSAYYAPREKIASITHATAMLGMSVLENLVIEATLIETFSALDGQIVNDMWPSSMD